MLPKIMTLNFNEKVTPANILSLYHIYYAQLQVRMNVLSATQKQDIYW